MRFVDVVCRNGVDIWPDLNESDMSDFGPSLTRQSEAMHTDINIIMAQYERTGTLPVMQASAMYEDVSEAGDFRDALERVNQASELFDSLPARVRNRFENDPGMFLEYFAQPGHDAELIELGLKAAPPPGEPPKVA